MSDLSCPVRCPHDSSLHAFKIDGKRYHLMPCRDYVERGRPHRVTIREVDAEPGKFPRYWEISEVLVKGPRSRFVSLRNAFSIEFPDAETRTEAARLVAAMLAQGDLQKVDPLVAHSI